MSSSIIASDVMSTSAIVSDAIGSFHGGVYPPENKSQSMQLPTGECFIPKELVLPLNQHTGAPATAIVNVGDTVVGGQKIAEPTGAFSAAIHAPSSGTVRAIEERTLPHASGMSGICIVIETDGQHTQTTMEPWADYQQQSPSTLIQRVCESGITGLGGAGFPTSVKLKPQEQYNIDTLILNGTECEPYITADHSLMLHHAEAVINGALLLAYILEQPKQIILGVEDNKPDAITALENAIKKIATPERLADGQSIQIMTFPTKYPSGGEKQLIQLLTNKEVPSGSIPASLGIVMQNVGTAVAAYEAVVNGQPLTSRITTLVGESLKTQRNLYVLLGTPVNDLLDHLGYQNDNNEKLIMGGPMMGFELPSANVPIIKSSNCIIAPSLQELPPAPEAQECIRCGMCAEACPASLLPQQLYWYSKAEDYERAQSHHLFDCIECGACSFVCPSNIPLVQYYRAAKGAIKHIEKEKIKSDHARQRFEFRKLRIERAEAEKAAKREARKQAAAEAKRIQAEKLAAKDTGDTTKTEANGATVDPVAAAMARVKAKQQDPVEQKAKLERTIASTQDRIAKLNEKLATADAENNQDQKDRFAAQIKQAELRLADAEKQLASIVPASSPATKTETDALLANKDKDTTPASNAAAAQAIAKAKANTVAMANMSAEEKQKKNIESLTQRLEKAKERLANAEKDNSEHVDAFKVAAEKLEQKLATAQAEISASAD